MENKEATVKVELTKNEAVELLGILNLNLRKTGIEDGGEVASSTLFFLNKINQAFIDKEAAEQKTEKPTGKN